MRALKMRSVVVGHWKLTMTERIIKADPLANTQEAAKELNVNHSMVIQHLKQTGKVKKLDKSVPHVQVYSVTSVVSHSLRLHGPELTRFLCPWDSPSKNTGVGCHTLF